MSRKILFLCTANSCRSILSEAVFNHYAPAGWRAYSAGSFPKGAVHPLTLKTLQQAGIRTEGLYSKASDDLAELKPDIVITVCDKAAGEACPVFFGSALKAHWGLSDPSECQGTAAEMDAAFAATLAHITRRTQTLLSLPLDQMNAEVLLRELQRIGQL